jgi:hypothetical protein
MGRLTKEAWAKSSLRTKEVEVEELGGSVLIRELPASISADLKGLLDVVQVGQEQRAKIDVATMERRQFAYGVVDENNNPLFTEDEVADLQDKHGRAFRVVLEAIDEFSGIDKEAIEEAEARFPVSGKATANGGEAQRPGAPAGSDGPDLSARASA